MTRKPNQKYDFLTFKRDINLPAFMAMHGYEICLLYTSPSPRD